MADDPETDDKPARDVLTPRFHAAHASRIEGCGESATVTREPLLAAAGTSPVHGADQLHRQAAEISDHLRTRQHRLALWESRLNARSAEWDDQQRSARLWLRERQAELDSRARALACQMRQLDEQTRQLAAREQTVSTLEQLALTLEQREAVLAQRESEWKSRDEQARRNAAEQRRQAARWNELAEYETALQTREATLEERSRMLESERETWLTKHRQQRRSLAARCQAHRRRRHAQQTIIRQRELELDQSKRSFERARVEVRRQQQRLMELCDSLLRQHHTLRTRREALHRWWTTRCRELAARQAELERREATREAAGPSRFMQDSPPE